MYSTLGDAVLAAELCDYCKHLHAVVFLGSFVAMHPILM